MKKRRIFVFISSAYLVLLLCSSTVYCQNAISSNGNSGKTYRYQMDYTLGETVIQTYRNNELVVTQGVHQSKLIITNLNQNSDQDYSIKVFPNPTSSLLYIDAKNVDLNEISYALYDVNGNVLKTNKIIDFQTIVNIKDISSGEFLLKIIQKKSVVENYKIIKQ